MMVLLQDDQALMFGNDATSPAYLCKISSIGKLGVSENVKHSKAIADIMKKELDIAPAKGYIIFSDVPAHEWAQGGVTFAK